MLDFLYIATRSSKKNVIEVYPKFKVGKTSDLMIRGSDFYAIWDDEKKLWSTDEFDAIRLIDKEIDTFVRENTDRLSYNNEVKILYLWDSDSGMITKWHKYCQKDMEDTYHPLDAKVIFANDEVRKEDYSSKKLPYPLEDHTIDAYDYLISTLYEPDERHKIEWAIGSIIAGDSKTIQKFLVLYGEAGTGKSTILNIIQKLFEGYWSTFDAKALGMSSNSFALEAFKSNPLVAIQHDGDLSRIEDNTRLNSLVAHESMVVNEKFKSTYNNRFNSMLFIGTNRPVKITDAKSGLLRRLIDVSPSGKKLTQREYDHVMSQIEFELGGIAKHCLDIYLENPEKYNHYIPISMMGASNDFYNFVLESYDVFVEQDGTTLKAAWEMYKNYAEDANIGYTVSMRVFREELKNYFWEFKERASVEGEKLRSYYSGFRTDKFLTETRIGTEEEKFGIKMDFTDSIFDMEFAGCPAQYATKKGTPKDKWSNVKTKLADLDTTQEHYVKVPHDLIVIDFDLKDEDGNKDPQRNLEAANKWPPTYTEYSKSGAGIHLHYYYTGEDVEKLSRVYDDNIEIKVFTGKASLRRRLTNCNNLPIASISSGLPLKEEKKMVDTEVIKSEKGLRSLIIKNLNKEVHPATTPSINFIHHILDQAYNSDLIYDVSDMYNDVLAFAASSHNQADYCIKKVGEMHFSSKHESLAKVDLSDDPIVFYDIEVFPNLFLINWKLAGEGNPMVRMINPKPSDIEDLIKMKLVGFNNRRYDNHLVYARLMGYNNEQLFQLSQDIINSPKGDLTHMFREAYNLSYTDIYDFSSAANKKSLKKWEIELGLHHLELGLPWDQPVPEDMWEKVAEYCDNDVISTEAVFNCDTIQADWTARQILAELADMTVNDTTNQLTTRFIFGKEREPNLWYTDLATGKTYDGNENLVMEEDKNKFEGYEYVKGKNIYRDIDVGKGGYVYAKEGIYGNVKVFDIASMHPNSIINMKQFGEYTPIFEEIVKARVLIKHGDFEEAGKMLNGRLSPYLTDKTQAKSLANALKTAINSVYGLTAATFQNPFYDKRNNNNITALRGALFMKTLQDAVTDMGYEVIHIKTDSIKIANADDKVEKFIMEFGEKYGYTFEIEDVFDKICLINHSEYIARDPDGKWHATGKAFAHPYIFKTLFSHEPIVFDDYCEVREVKKSNIYMDYNENLPEDEHDYHFVGRIGSFVPVKPGAGGALLVSNGVDKEGNVKYDSVNNTKDTRWLESELVKGSETEKNVDKDYFRKIVDEALAKITEFGDEEMTEWFISDQPYAGSMLEAEHDVPF